MAYTVGFVLFDLGGLYSAGLPTLSGTLSLPALGAPSTATSSLGPLSIRFAAPPNPPGAPGTFLLTDPAGPGDFFRSGTLGSWPPEPASVVAGTAVVPLGYASLAAGVTLPLDIPIPGGVTAAVGAATGLLFMPFNIRLTSLVLGPSPVAGRIRARFRGVINYVTVFVPRRTDLTGSVDLTLAPSGDAAAAATIVTASASDLSLSPGLITPLSTVALVLLAPALSGALSGPLTAAVNTAIAPRVAAVRALLPLTPAGTPLFSAAATVSARRITVLPSGIVVQAVLSELVAVPGGGPGSGGGGGGPTPGAENRFVVGIEPAPEFDIARTYLVTVRRHDDLAAVEGASVAIRSFAPITGAAVSVSSQTNPQGVAALTATLGSRVRPSTDPTHAGGFDITWPSLTVTKAGFQSYSQQLGN